MFKIAFCHRQGYRLDEIAVCFTVSANSPVPLFFFFVRSWTHWFDLYSVLEPINIPGKENS